MRHVAEGVLEGDAVPVPEHPRVVPRHRARRQAGPEAGQSEPGALLLHEHADAEGPRGREAAVAEQVDGGQRADHTERSVVRAAVEHGVEVGAGEDSRAGGRRRPPPGDRVAEAVPLDLQAPRGALLDEPRVEPRARQR